MSRRPDRSDPRRNAVRITRAGARALGKLDGQVDAAQKVLLEPLSEVEGRQLISLLQRLREPTAPERPADQATQ